MVTGWSQFEQRRSIVSAVPSAWVITALSPGEVVRQVLLDQHRQRKAGTGEMDRERVELGTSQRGELGGRQVHRDGVAGLRPAQAISSPSRA